MSAGFTPGGPEDWWARQAQKAPEPQLPWPSVPWPPPPASSARQSPTPRLPVPEPSAWQSQVPASSSAPQFPAQQPPVPPSQPPAQRSPAQRSPAPSAPSAPQSPAPSAPSAPQSPAPWPTARQSPAAQFPPLQSSVPQSSIPWSELWSWLGGRLAVAGRGLALFGLALFGLVLLGALAATLALLPFLTVNLIGTDKRGDAAAAGFLAIVAWLTVGPLLLLWMRSLARLTRKLADRWCGVPIAEPYLPRPWADGGKHGPRQWLGWLLRDQATWRDLAWVAVDGLLGWLLALLPAALLFLGILGVFAPSFASGSIRFLAIVGAAAGLWACPWLLRGYGHFAHSMLAPTKEAELALRVRQLAQTRTEAIDTSAAEIRRIERDLHDGAQARLVAMGMTLDAAGQIIDTNPDAARALLFEARDASVKALAELRDLVRGIHPPVLADRGLTDAIRALALDSPMRIDVVSDLHGRASAPVESAAYFAVSELLANVSKHAEARQTWIDIRHTDDMLRIGVTDNGHGGADPSRGSGLRGIERRLASFDGVLAVSSPPGGPTAVTMEIPCELSLPKTSSSLGTA
jgi:signal transduction histidine kinase